MGRKIEVYYDGNCPFCVASRDRISAIDRAKNIVFRDIGDSTTLKSAECRFSLDALTEEMHARLPDGTWRVGYFAWVEVVRRLPHGVVVANLLSCPPIAEVGHAAYKLFASHRYAISRFLRLPAPCDANGCALPMASTYHGVI